MNRKITAVLIGAGQRGAQVYSAYALKNPDKFEVVAVAEPNNERRNEFAVDHKLPEEKCFTSWEELLEQDKMADVAMICTQDKMHFSPTIKAIEKGYHILCEKPMSTNAEECVKMAQAAEKHDRILKICYVLRYAPFMAKLKEIIESKVIGNMVSMQYLESVDFWHQAHSFVRGNWRRSDETSPMIMAKSCHDMDMMLWLVGRNCISVSSYGSLKHFKEENAPEGSAKRCFDCKIQDDCPYNAEKIYVKDEKWYSKIIRKVVSIDPSTEAVRKALKTSDYGRCVYHCDNDVVDHQVVNLLFEDDVTVSFTMCGFTYGGGRTINIMGTHGQIKGDMESNLIEVVDFLSGQKKLYQFESEMLHGGGDDAFMLEFLQSVRNEEEIVDYAKGSVMSHIMALASEESRISGRTITINDYF